LDSFQIQATQRTRADKLAPIEPRHGNSVIRGISFTWRGESGQVGAAERGVALQNVSISRFVFGKTGIPRSCICM